MKSANWGWLHGASQVLAIPYSIVKDYFDIDSSFIHKYKLLFDIV